MTGHTRTALLCASALTAVSAPAAAQDQTPQNTAAPAAQSVDEIVVTGSRIAGVSDRGAVAVSTYDDEAMETLAPFSTGEILENLPSAGSFEFNEAADGPNSARGDIATVNLRALGSGNTLVLLNGRRLAPHGVSQDIGATPRQITNVNSIPSAALSRIEVLRDGASALYGSDATAGVVNTIINADPEAAQFRARYGAAENSDLNSYSFGGTKGFEFNGGDTRLTLVGQYYHRNGAFATEFGPQVNNVDKRPLLEGTPFEGSSDFRNTSARSPYGQFDTGFLRPDGTFQGIGVTGGGVEYSDDSGTFHIQPCNYDDDFRVATGSTIDGCYGVGTGSLPVTLRQDYNSFQTLDAYGRGKRITLDEASAKGRQIKSDLDRYNFYATGEHEFGNGVEAFAETLVYHSETAAQRATQPIDDGLAYVIVPAENYWNPFGPVGSENRLPGIDAPAEGLDVLISRWRPVEVGPRFFDTESTTYRVLGGLRGDWNGWDWETAAFHSANSTTDTSRNRMSKTALHQELAKTTPDAINPFGGPNANSQEQLDRIRLTVENVGEAALTSADFRATNDALFSLPGGDVGFATGTEWRHEYYKDDRDERLDGTIQFSGGENSVASLSDVVGVSPTEDSEASRDVFAGFAETFVPIVGPDQNIPFVYDLNIQAAVRLEYFSDTEEAPLKPKIGLAYFPVEWLHFRAAYSQGFRAPNLVQLNRGDISRLNREQTDFYREFTGDPDDTGETYRQSIRASNPDLKSEETDTYVAGVEARASFFGDMRFYADFFRFEQTNVIDNTGVEYELAVDAVRRLEGGSNPNVIRAEVTPQDIADFQAYNASSGFPAIAPAGKVLYVLDPIINLDRQNVEGIDFGFNGSYDAGRLGEFSYSVSGSKLLERERVFPEQDDIDFSILEDYGIEIDGSVATPGEAQDTIELNGNPEWRVLGTVSWRKERWGAGASVRYISGYDDTSAEAEINGEDVFYRVDDWTVFNGYVDYRFNAGPADPLRLRLGIKNIFNEKPPLLDESYGYDPSYHDVTGRFGYVQLLASF